MNIYLVRHGETEHNRLGYYSNQDEDLNNTGIFQAEELKKKVKEIHYDVCFCSPLLRTVHTANILNIANKIIIPEQRLVERNPNNLNGKSLEYTDRDEYWNYYSKIKYGNEESMQTLFSRVFSFLNDLKERPYNDVLIVVHSGVSKAFYAYFNGVPNDGKFLYLGLKNCEVKCYRLTGNRINMW